MEKNQPLPPPRQPGLLRMGLGGALRQKFPRWSLVVVCLALFLTRTIHS